MLSSSEEFMELPPLSCGWIIDAVAITVIESASAVGQVLLLEGVTQGGEVSSVKLVDLATGRPGYARRSLPSSWRANIWQQLGCQMGALSAPEVSMAAVHCQRRRCGARQCREQKMQHGPGERSPRVMALVMAATDA
mmetsp:Transcript_13300/g.21610  ORF Transcript_13300/g.21610 Transcript_13300/m.21610 type:complete len:137 (+) Transcript_13300:506-916(+)